MIVIYDVKYYEVESMESAIAKITSPSYFCVKDNAGNTIESDVINETIHGRRYVDKSRNLDVVVGIKEDIAEILGLQYNCFISMSDRIASQSKHINHMDHVTQSLVGMVLGVIRAGFWKRLKYLFTGKII